MGWGILLFGPNRNAAGWNIVFCVFCTISLVINYSLKVLDLVQVWQAPSLCLCVCLCLLCGFVSSFLPTCNLFSRQERVQIKIVVVVLHLAKDVENISVHKLVFLKFSLVQTKSASVSNLAFRPH